MNKKLEYFFYEWKGWGNWACSDSRKDNSSSVTTGIWRDGVKRMDPGSAQQCPAIAQEAETDAQEVPLEHEEEYFYCASDHRVPRESVDSPSLEIFHTCLDAIPCQVAWDNPAWAGKLDQMTCCGPVQPDPCHDSVKWRATICSFLCKVNQKLTWMKLYFLNNSFTLRCILNPLKKITGYSLWEEWSHHRQVQAD